MRKTTIQFSDSLVPEWTYAGLDQSIYTFVSAIALAGLEDKDIRLSPSLQKRMMGFAVFGKQKFCIRKDGTYHVSNKCSFGGDFNDMAGPCGEIGLALSNRQVLRPGWFGKGIFDRSLS